jgi:sugar lactone lactonase YvrE
MALDVKGTLYLTGGKDLTVYAAGESSPARTIKVSGWAVALDKSGLLYAAYNPSIVFGVCPCGNVYVYESRGIKLLRKIRAFEPSSLAFDASNNLYVANTYEHDEVAVYANGGVVPFRRITNGIASPHALAFDNAGDLYVANSASNSIGVYARTGGTPIRVITEGVSNPVALVFDKTGNLYVANRASRGKGTVTVYAPGRSSPLHILHSGAFMPDALAIETTSADLYVAESAWGNGNGQVAVFKQGATKPYATILKGIDSPIALSFSP